MSSQPCPANLHLILTVNGFISFEKHFIFKRLLHNFVLRLGLSKFLKDKFDLNVEITMLIPRIRTSPILNTKKSSGEIRHDHDNWFAL